MENHYRPSTRASCRDWQPHLNPPLTATTAYPIVRLPTLCRAAWASVSRSVVETETKERADHCPSPGLLPKTLGHRLIGPSWG